MMEGKESIHKSLSSALTEKKWQVGEQGRKESIWLHLSDYLYPEDVKGE